MTSKSSSNLLSRVINFKYSLSPFYLYYFITWMAVKFYQIIFNQKQSILETSWESFLRSYGDDHYNLYVSATNALTLAIMISYNVFFMFLDFFLIPKGIRKYKIQQNMNEPPDFKKFLKALIWAIINGIIVAFPYSIAAFYIVQYRGIPDVHILPQIHVFLIEGFLCLFIYEITFYASHRLLHHKFFYKHVHKIHHEWTSSVSIVALYCHPFEFLIANMWPMTAGLFILGCHITSYWAFLLVLLYGTLGDHSGYHLPFMHSSEFHDFHHLRFNVNYGAIGWMDRLFQTDASFKDSINSLRHRNLFTLESAREKFPDGNEKMRGD